jgi:hypothetical protein
MLRVMSLLPFFSDDPRVLFLHPPPCEVLESFPFKAFVHKPLPLKFGLGLFYLLVKGL